jgi:hypothetical protein
MTINTKILDKNTATKILFSVAAITSLTITVMNILAANKAKKIFYENNCTMIKRHVYDYEDCSGEDCETTEYDCPTKPEFCVTACENIDYHLVIFLLGICGLASSCVCACIESKPVKKAIAKLSEMTVFHKKEEKKPLTGDLATSYGTDETIDIETAIKHTHR